MAKPKRKGKSIFIDSKNSEQALMLIDAAAEDNTVMQVKLNDGRYYECVFPFEDEDHVAHMLRHIEMNIE